MSGHIRTTGRLLLCLMSLIALTAGRNCLAAPANDNFANRILLTGNSLTENGTLSAATAEAGEPFNAGISPFRTVWYHWVSPVNGQVRVDTQLTTSGLDTLLGVYTGSAVNALTTIATDNNSGGGTTSLVTINVTKGTDYSIVIDYGTGSFGTGAFALRLAILAPSNDNQFPQSQIPLLSGYSVTTSGHNINSTAEQGFDTNSVWYKWIAPNDGNLTFTATCTGFVPVIFFYQNYDNTPPDDPNTDGDNIAQVTYFVTSGQEYEFAVTSASGQGAIDIALTLTPTNDAYANAVVLSGYDASVSGFNINATAEFAFENGAPDVWYTWTAPANVVVNMDTSASPVATFAYVLTGNPADPAFDFNANFVGGAFAAPGGFTATAGTLYSFLVVDANFQANATFNLTLHAVPANDNFSAAQVITGAVITVAGTNINATVEGGEQGIIVPGSGNPLFHSVWYQWTAPYAGPVTLDTIGSDFDTVLGVFTGNSVNSLTQLTADDQAGGNNTSLLTFNATANTTYYFSVDGFQGLVGNITLHLVLPPPNDVFAAAIALQPDNDSLSGQSNIGATTEVNEPLHFNGATNSVWYTFTVTRKITVTLLITTDGFTANIGVYTGATVGALTAVTAEGQGTLSFSGDVGKTYRICITGDQNSFGTFTIAASTTNSPPVVNNVTLTVAEDSDGNSLSNQALFSATDADGNTLSYNFIPPKNGTVGIIDPVKGTFAYTPKADFFGQDIFTYTANDGTATSPPATVTVTVTPVNDQPVFTAEPSATPNPQSVNKPVNFTAAATDADGTLSFVWGFGDGTSGNGSTVSHSYTSGGTKSVSLTVTDPQGGSVKKTLSLRINTAPTVANVTLAATEDTNFNGTLTGIDADGDTLKFSKVTDPQHGTLTTFNNSGTFVYAPAANYNGTDSFTFKVNDGIDDSNTATVTFNIASVDDPTTFTSVAPVGTVVAPFNANIDQSVAFTVAATDIDGALTYVWDFGDGSSAAGDSVSHSYALPNTYTVTLTATDAARFTSTKTITIKVNSDPIVGSKLAVGLAFTKVNTDKVTYSGTILVPDGVSFFKTFAVDVAGLKRSATLDKAGKAKILNGVETTTVAVPKPNAKTKLSKVTVALAKGSLSTAGDFLDKAGYGRTSKTFSVNVKLFLGTQAFLVSVPQTYTVKLAKGIPSTGVSK